MDLIKNCTTNLWSTESLEDYNIIRCGYSSNRTLLSLLTIAHDIRKHNVLCTVADGELHVISQDSYDKLQDTILQEHELDFIEEETFNNFVSYDRSAVLDLLASAIGSSLSITLSQELGLRRLGRLRWLVCNTHLFSPGATVLQLHVDITATNAVTVLCSSHSLVIQPNEEHVVEGSPVTLAPSGICCKTASPAIPLDGGWQHNIRIMLQTEGILIDSSAAWQSVELPELKRQFWWPMELCYQVRPDTRRNLHVMHPSTATNMPAGYQDMLSFAESWLGSAGDRQMQIKEEQASKNDLMQDHDFDSMLDASQARFDSTTVTSPPFQHRADLVNTLSVYPTPPDGMTAAATQASVLSEAAPPAPHSVDQSESLFRTTTHDDDILMQSRARGPSVASSVGPSFRQNVDDLFGEVDTDLRDAEIGDDDFDFFDDGDDVTMMDDLTTPSVQVHLPQVHVEQYEGTSTSPQDKAESNTISELGVQPMVPDSATTPSPAPVLINEQAATTAQALDIPTYKPLSPFDIRERLLPPPIPASVVSSAQQERRDQDRHSFHTLTFNAGNDFLSKHRPVSETPDTRTGTWRNRHLDLDDSSSEVSEEDEYIRVPSLPWKKRLSSGAQLGDYVSWEISALDQTSAHDMEDAPDFLGRLFAHAHVATKTIDTMDPPQRGSSAGQARWFGRTAEDRMNIAQLLTQQSITCVQNLIVGALAHTDTPDSSDDSRSALVPKLIASVRPIFPSLSSCDLNALILVKETLRWQSAPVKGQPRPQLRQESTQALDTQLLPAPYLHFRRGEQQLDVLPPALHFWPELGLAPIGPGKNVAVYCVVPPSLPATMAFDSFWTSLAATYQACNLGTMRIGNLGADQIQVTHLIPCVTSSQDDIEHTINAMFTELREKLSSNSPTTGEVPMLCMVDIEDDAPFLCSVFAEVQKMLRKSGLDGSSLADQLVLQILPLSLLTEASLTHTLRVQELAYLAREVYDRVPVSHETIQKSPLAIACTPAVLLTEQLPKRIHLQLAAEPPSDLLHDNSELHVAYSRSHDEQWMTFCWLDSSGSAQDAASFYLHGTDMAAVAQEVMVRTIDILQSRPVSWRVTIATDSSILEEDSQCWRSAAAAASLRKGALTVTLVTIDKAPTLTLHTTAVPDLASTSAATPANPGGSFLTPVTTPQGASFPVSPDAGTPSTPNQPDTSETDTETHLVDLPDETWRILLNTNMYKAAEGPRRDHVLHIAQGVLVKHGEMGTGQPRKLPMVAVGLVWSLRVKSGGSGVEHLHIRQAEVMLREILATYRSHGLLAKARGLVGAGEECLPLHLLCAMRGAAALDGFS